MYRKDIPNLFRDARLYRHIPKLNNQPIIQKCISKKNLYKKMLTINNAYTIQFVKNNYQINYNITNLGLLSNLQHQSRIY